MNQEKERVRLTTAKARSILVAQPEALADGDLAVLKRPGEKGEVLSSVRHSQPEQFSILPN